MKRTLITTGRAVVLAAALLGLTAACTGDDKTTNGSGANSGQSQQGQNPGSIDLSKTGMSEDCQEFTKLMQEGSQTLLGEAAGMRQFAQKVKAESFDDPQLQEAAEKLAQYYEEHAAYKEDTSADAPRSQLLNEAVQAYTSVCAKR